jgi:diacylglycerol kinase family enzyme
LVEYIQVKKYSIIPSKHDPMNIDGETIGSTPIEVNVLPRAYEVYVPKQLFIE